MQMWKISPERDVLIVLFISTELPKLLFVNIWIFNVERNISEAWNNWNIDLLFTMPS